MTMQGAENPLPYGGPFARMFHGFAWGNGWSNDSQYAFLACGEGDVGIFRFLCGTGAVPIVVQGWGNQAQYFYMNDVDTYGSVTVGAGVSSGVAYAMNSSTLANLPNWPITLPGTYSSPFQIMGVRRVWVDSTYAYFACPNNPGIVAVANLSTGVVVTANAPDDWTTGGNGVYFTYLDRVNQRYYTVDTNGNAIMWDVSVLPSPPTILHEWSASGIQGMVAVGTSRVYTFSGSTVSVWNVSSLSSPVVLNTYTVPGSGNGNHNGASNPNYSTIGINAAGTRLYLPWGDGAQAGVDILSMAGDTIAWVNSPAAPLFTDADGNSIFGFWTYAGCKPSPDGSKLCGAWGAGGQNGYLGHVVQKIDDDSGTVLQTIATGAETKNGLINADGSAFAIQQYSSSVIDADDNLTWAYSDSIGSGFQLHPLNDTNVWYSAGRGLYQDRIVQTNGSAAPTVISAPFPGSIQSFFDGTYLYRVMNQPGGTASGNWGLEISTLGPSGDGYLPLTVVDFWTSPNPFSASGGGAIHVEGVAGTPGSRAYISDQAIGLFVLDLSAVVGGSHGNITMITAGDMPDPILSTSILLRYYGVMSVANVTGGHLEVGTGNDFYALYIVYFDSGGHPLGAVLPCQNSFALNENIRYIDLSGDSSNASPPGGISGVNALQVTLNFLPAGAASVKLYAQWGGSTSFDPFYTGVSLSGAGLVDGAVLTLSSAPTTWSGAMPTALGVPHIAGATVSSGQLYNGSDARAVYQATIIYQDAFGDVCGFSANSNTISLQGQTTLNAATITLPTGTPGDGVIPIGAAAQAVWIGYYTFGVAPITFALETTVGNFTTSSITISSNPSTWEEASSFPGVLYDNFESIAAFSAAGGSNSIKAVGTGSNKRIVFTTGDSGARIYNPTTLLHTGQIPGITNTTASQTWAVPGSDVIANRWFCFQYYTASGSEGGAWGADFSLDADAPTMVDLSTDFGGGGFAVLSMDNFPAAISWFTPQAGVLVVGSLSGLIVFVFEP